MAINSAEVIRQGGDLFYAPWQSVPTVSAANMSSIKSTLDALSVQTVGLISGFNTSMLFDDIQELNAMNCGYGTILTEATQKANLKATLLQTRNLDFWNTVMKGFRGTIAATPVAVTGEVMKATPLTWASGDQFILANADGDGTLVASIVIKNNGSALTLTTNYLVSLVDGKTVITMVTSGTAAGAGLTADYSYTPSAASMFAYNYEKVSLPYGIYKFVSCTYTDGAATKRDIIYLVKHRLDGEAVAKFLNTGENPEGTEISLVGELGGQYFWYTETL